MQLITKESRDSLNIDTFERAIVLALLQLRKGLRQDNEATQNLSYYFQQEIRENVKQIDLVVDVKIPFFPIVFSASGGDFLKAIESLTLQPVEYVENIQPTSSLFDKIPREPELITTVEQYLVWAVSSWIILKKNQVTTDLQRWDKTGYYSILIDRDPPSFSAKVILPFDYNAYTKSGNLIGSVLPSITTIYTNFIAVHPDNENTLSDSLVGDDNLFGDDFLVGD